MTITEPTIKLLWGHSGNRCSNPECRRRLIEEPTDSDPHAIIGEMAHIAGQRPTSARYDATMPPMDRDQYDNLILLCPMCHAKIDRQPNRYPVRALRQMKRDHTEWVERRLKRKIQDVTFVELESVMKYIMSGQAADNTSFGLVAPAAKIRKNTLSAKVAGLIKTGMSRVGEVTGYLDRHPDVQFGARLNAGFVDEYTRQKQGGLSGDALFMSLWKYTAGSGAEELRRAAGLTVLAYLFETCEVFEK